MNASLNFTPVQIVEEKIVAALKHSLVPDHIEYYDLPDHEAKRTGSGENVSSITYTIPYTGNIADFDMGTSLQKAEFEGVIYDNVILLAFRFEGDVDTHAPLIKQKKDNFLRLVRENQQQLVSQLADIRQDMYVLLTAAADKIIEAKRQNLADAKKFL